LAKRKKARKLTGEEAAAAALKLREGDPVADESYPDAPEFPTVDYSPRTHPKKGFDFSAGVTKKDHPFLLHAEEAFNSSKEKFSLVLGREISEVEAQKMREGAAKQMAQYLEMLAAGKTRSEIETAIMGKDYGSPEKKAPEKKPAVASKTKPATKVKPVEVPSGPRDDVPDVPVPVKPKKASTAQSRRVEQNVQDSQRARLSSGISDEYLNPLTAIKPGSNTGGKQRSRAAQRNVTAGTERNQLGSVVYQNARRSLGSDVRALGRLDNAARDSAFTRLEELTSPTNTDRLPEMVRQQLLSAAPQDRQALLQKFLAEHRDNPQYANAVAKVKKTIGEIKRNHPLYLRNEIEGSVVKGRRTARLNDINRRASAEIRLPSGRTVTAKMIRTRYNEIKAGQKAKKAKLQAEFGGNAANIGRAFKAGYAGNGGPLMGLAALAAGTGVGMVAKHFGEVRDENKLRLEGVQQQAQRDSLTLMQNQGMKAHLQNSISENLMRLQSESPELYARVSAGRVLPQGAVVIGGAPRQDLLQQLGMSMSNNEFAE